ncbi:MAG: hypothetical protein IJ423_01730 [Clostridia bacterium]|nr:hypothetical protein [Clostridia bacterium]
MDNKEKQFDDFSDYTFSGNEWSAPTLKYAAEIEKELEKMQLVGRQIKNMKMIGLSYYLTRDCIESAAYNMLSNLPEDERQDMSNYKNISPDMGFSRCSKIDEPFLIEFDDGDVFEIDTPQDMCYRFSMNCIPWHIDAGTNLPNADANKIFSVCIGKKIVEIEVCEYTDGFEAGKGFVSRIVLWLENDIGLCIHPVFDYCRISCIDKNNEDVFITFKDLKDALFNYEDLHTDDTLDFEGSHTLYFGEKGSEYAETPYMSLVPSNKETALHISVDDFDLFRWSMTIVLKENFDEYGDYGLPYNQWNEVLVVAKKILDFKTFDELFDYIVSQIDNGLWYLNNHGAEFWNNKEKYETQLSDVSKWSELVLNKDDVLNIYGF